MSEHDKPEAAAQAGGSDSTQLLALRRQVERQYAVVAAQAKILQELAEAHVAILKCRDVPMEDFILELQGKTSALWMESIGDFLNGVDAVGGETEWMNPIFESAHKLFPVER